MRAENPRMRSQTAQASGDGASGSSGGGPVEPSEEVRLLLTRLLGFVVTQVSPWLMAPVQGLWWNWDGARPAWHSRCASQHAACMRACWALHAAAALRAGGRRPKPCMPMLLGWAPSPFPQVGLAVCAYAAEVLAVLEAALGDAYHEVNLEACACIEALVGERAARQQSSRSWAAAGLRCSRFACTRKVLTALHPCLVPTTAQQESGRYHCRFPGDAPAAARQTARGRAAAPHDAQAPPSARRGAPRAGAAYAPGAWRCRPSQRGSSSCVKESPRSQRAAAGP